MTDGLDTLEEKIEEYKKRMATFLIEGGAKNYEQYVQYVGRVEAFDIILQDIKDTREILIES